MRRSQANAQTSTVQRGERTTHMLPQLFVNILAQICISAQVAVQVQQA